MSFRISRPLFFLAILLAAAPALRAQEPIPRDNNGRLGWPIAMTPRQHIATSTFFGGTLGATAGVVAGWGASQLDCRTADRQVGGCDRRSELPKYGVTLGVGTGAYVSATRAAVEAGCDAGDARRRARRGAVRGFIAGVAPMLVYHALDDDPRVGWTLAAGASALQVASIAHSTAGCVRGR